MTAPAMDERREVARRLRSAKYGWRSWERALYDAIGCDLETAGSDMLDRLADLIDPNTDGRDALLALAGTLESEAEECGRLYVDTGEQEMAGEYTAYRDCARRIREALGVSDV